LLLALLDNPSAAEVLRACAANIDDLRKALGNFIKDNTPQVAGTEEVDTQPTLGFQRERLAHRLGRRRQPTREQAARRCRS
jgi:ATP-dependent Clp protease ATP-binding subunit ClpA